MKKILFLFFVCLEECALAQKSFFGVDAGINVANQREHIIIDPNRIFTGASLPPQGSTLFFKNSIKPTIGVFYQYGFTEKIGLRLNAQFMGLGCAGPTGLYAIYIPINNPDIYYLTLPLTFHYSVNKHLSFNAGPYLSFTLGGTKYNGGAITKYYHKNDDGFSFGGEHDLYKNFAISVNYIFGLKNIWLNDTSYNGMPVTQNKITNRALQLTLIYKFRKTN